MIIFLYGPDTFRAQQKIVDVRTKFISEVDPTGSSVVTVDGAKTTIEELAALSKPASLFVKRRLIIITHSLQNKNKEFTEELEKFLTAEKNNENILLIYEAGFIEKKLGGKNVIMKPGPDDKTAPLNKAEKKLFDRLAQSQFTQYFGILPTTELIKYIIKLAQQSEVTLSVPAAQLLIRLVGDDVWSLAQEIAKLSAYALSKTKKKEAPVITETDIHTLVHQSVTENIFALTDALGSRQINLALRLLQDQMNSGLNSHYLLTMILWQFKTLAAVRQALDSGQNNRDLARTLGLHPYVLEKSINQVRKFNFANLQKTINQLVAVDYKAKSGGGTVEELLPVLISQL